MVSDFFFVATNTPSLFFSKTLLYLQEKIFFNS